jgi:hypothetical protein
MPADRDLTDFFSCKTRQRQFERLHKLWFEYIESYRQDVEQRLLSSVEEVYRRHNEYWKKESRFESSNQHHGILRIRPAQSNDIFVHVGWQKGKFWADVWVGVLISKDDPDLLARLRDATEGTFENEKPSSDKRYSVYQTLKGWKSAEEWDNRIIDPDFQFSEYGDMLDSGFLENTGRWVEIHLDKLVCKIDRLLAAESCLPDGAIVPPSAPRDITAS